MSTLLRFAGVMLMVLVAAFLLLPCGATDGDICLHACCVRPRPVGGVRATVARVLAALSPRRLATAFSTMPLYGAPLRAALAGVRPEVAPLRL